MSTGKALALRILDLVQDFLKLSADQQLAAQTRQDGWRTHLRQGLGMDSISACAHLDKLLQIAATLPEPGKHEAQWQCIVELDAQFGQIHPRQPSRVAGGASRNLPAWLKDLKRLCENQGFFAEKDGKRLLLRGPLGRAARSQDDTYACDALACCSYLTLAACSYSFQNRDIAIEQACHASNDGGVLAASNPHAALCLLPLAKYASDLSTTEKTIGNTPGTDYRLAQHLNAADLIWQGLQEGQCCHPKLDLLMAPELLVRAEHVQALRGKLQAAPQPVRLLLAGSGHSEEQNAAGMHWNEACLLNHRGKLLWKQRKIWLAASGEPRHYEYNAAGDRIVLADLDGFGRCLVLICQDCKLDFMRSLLAEWQPDWILIPILDYEASPGRWMHQQGFDLSEVSPARILVLSSLALGDTDAASPHSPASKHCALAICAKKPPDMDKARALQSVNLLTDAAQAATLVWDSSTWPQSTLDSKLPKK